LDLLLTSGLPWQRILFTVLVDWVMIITGLVGALTTTRYKWGYFTFGCAALFYIIYTLAIPARRHAAALGSDVSRAYNLVGIWTLTLWVLYPIAWGVSEGGNIISPDSENVFYGVLDVLAKIGFGAILLWGHRNIDPARLGLKFRSYDEDFGHGYGSAGEKRGLGGGAGNGAGVVGTGNAAARAEGTSNAPVATA
jgi:bacteriorhodopsin